VAPLSRGFYSHYEFLTLCRSVVASAPFATLHKKGNKRLSLCLNPLITFVYQLIHPANCQMKVIKVWADPRSLATTSGIIGYFLFLGVLRCFSSPAYRSPALYIQAGATRYEPGRVSPFGHLRIKTYLAVPRSFSQLIASFIGILRQGILCVRLSNFLRSD
jgi:hypothetical protein